MGKIEPSAYVILKQAYPFRLMDDKDIAWIAKAGSVINFEAGQEFYHQGDPADFFYIIIDGDVSLSREIENQEVPLGKLGSNDFFGFEIVSHAPFYRINARASSAGQVFCLHRQSIFEILRLIPDLVLPFQMMEHSLRLSLSVDLDWQGQNEAIIYIDRRHPYFLGVRLLLPLILFFASSIIFIYLVLTGGPGTILPKIAAGFVTFATGFWIVWNYIDWTNDYSIITTRRTVFQEKVVFFYDSRQEVPLDTVQSSSIVTDQYGRLVGYGDLIIKTYSGTMAFPDLRHPEIVMEMLNDQRAHAAHQRDIEEKRALADKIEERLTVGEKISFPRQVPKQVTSTSLFQKLSNLLKMSWKQGNEITYRKHWFILLERAWLPFVLFSGCLVVLILVLFNAINISLDSVVILSLGILLLSVLGFWLWYQYEDWANDKYIINDDQIVDVYKKPLGSEEKQSASLKNIQSVEYERLGLLGVILNMGTVYIRVGDVRFHFDTVVNPAKVQNELFDHIARRNELDKRRELEFARKRVVDAVEIYHVNKNKYP